MLPKFLDVPGASSTERLRLVDWAETGLGPPETWPSTLQQTLATWLPSPAAMFVAWGPQLRFFFNDAYAPFLGARVEQAMAQPFHQLWSDIWPDINPIVKRALDGQGSLFEDLPLTMMRNGYEEQTWWSFTYMPLRDEACQVLGMFCTGVETTGKVLAQRRADHEQHRQRALLKQMPGFVAMVSGPEHVYEYVNDAYRSIAGPREFLGRTVREVFPELVGQGFYELMDGVYRTGVPFTAPNIAISLVNQPDVHYFDLLFHPVRDDDEQVTGVFIGGYDTTARIQAEQASRHLNETLEQRVAERSAELLKAQDALRHAQKLEAMGQLTGGVAHDFNNLLTVIGSSVALLRKPDLPDDRRVRFLDTIAETVRRAAKLTGQLLAFARRQPLNPETFDVAERTATVIDMVRPLLGPGIHITGPMAAKPLYAHADVNQFETALINLCINARDAMNGTGELVLQVRAVQQLPAAQGQPPRAGQFLAVLVRDTGCGIPPERLEQVFEPFYTTKPTGKGTGLGLSQVIGFAQQSGGNVTVESTPGNGSTFTLLLPSTPASVHRGLAVVTAPPQPPSTARLSACVLVVEDNEDVGRFTTEVLHDLGHRTAWARHAAQAIAMLEQSPGRFDLVFSDVIMPGMNGLELARFIGQTYPGLPVVLTSGYSEVLADEGSGEFQLLQKPYAVDDLAGVVGQAVSARSPFATDTSCEGGRPIGVTNQMNPR
ncbi:PAS domain-containing protein [Aquincola tertiaricarbonis]|uniref:PAS domain-containing protein n=1 Tax=Aquincola tertiaricarbonis TaxID=391953 RepID=UPI0009F89DB2|nr:PAS domain-containing protein [Aquincola tertiaricarbonis]